MLVGPKSAKFLGYLIFGTRTIVLIFSHSLCCLSIKMNLLVLTIGYLVVKCSFNEFGFLLCPTLILVVVVPFYNSFEDCLSKSIFYLHP